MLGGGGMGVVYEAIQISLDRRVALKVLRPELAHDPAFAERLRTEGRLQASLEHPNVLDVYEVGESPPGSLFLSMRLVEGATLADLLRDGELGAARALDLLEQVGGALDAAHAAGLVHRDVKPQNILVDASDRAFLADFGLSRAASDATAASRATVGTVAYVAPEVIEGEEPGPASDRYAFAATLFHCLTGEVPFPRGSDAATLYSHTSEPPPRAGDRRAELPAALDPLLAAGLAKDPARRPESAAALVASVREALGDRLESLGPPDRSRTPHSPPTLPTPAGPRPAPERAPPRRRPSGLVAAAAAGAAALGAGLALLLVGGGDDAGSPQVPIPPVAAGAQPLGSDLPAPDRSLDCGGDVPGAGARACSIVQADLPGAQLVAPADGEIVGWSVRGASGELALDVIRPRGADTTRVGRSQWESAGNDAPYYFETSLPVERGDQIGIELGPGAAIGVTDADGAATDRWLEPEGGVYGSPDRGAGTGFDYELALRADFVAGAQPALPVTLTGAAAARAADGTVRARDVVEISKPPASVDVALVEVGERVALDMFRGERRVARIFIPGLLPGGQPIDLQHYVYDGTAASEVDVWWVNPNSGRSIFHFFTVSEHQLEFIG